MFWIFPVSCPTLLFSSASFVHPCICHIFSFSRSSAELFVMVAMYILHRLWVANRPLSFWRILILARWDRHPLWIIRWPDIWLFMWSCHTRPWGILSIHGPRYLWILSSNNFSSRNWGKTAAMILFLISCCQFLQVINYNQSRSQTSLILSRAAVLTLLDRMYCYLDW